MTKRISPDSVVVDLTIDDEPEEERRQQLEPLQKKFKRANSKVKAEPRVKAEPDNGGGKIGSVASLQRQSGGDDGMEQDDEDCCVVAAPPKEITKAASNDDDDDEIELVGTANETKLPHMRQHCTEFPYQEGFTANRNNKSCSLCFCYVCDVPVKDCKSWEGNHSNATDSGPLASMWKAHRAGKSGSAGFDALLGIMRGISIPTGGSRASSPPPPTDRYTRGLKVGPGPFKPDDAVACGDRNLTECRNCGWYNRFFHRNFRQYEQLHPVGFLDWCMRCGLVASERDFGKVHSTRYDKQTGDICLGTRNMSFRVFARKPSEMTKYAAAWVEDDLTYDEAELQSDLFRHRFGKRPTPNMILDSIPIVEQEKLPKTGSFHFGDFQPRDYVTFSESREQQIYQQYCCQGRGMFSYWREQGTHDQVSVDETEGIIFDNPSDIAILRELVAFDALGLCEYNLTAKWDAQTQTGVFNLQLFIRPGRNTHYDVQRASFSKLLGAWFLGQNFPFPLKDICKTLPATTETGNNVCTTISLPVPPFYLTRSQATTYQAANKETMEAAVNTHNELVQTRRVELTFEPSNKNSNLGGTCPLETGFQQCIQRFFSEILVEDIVNCGNSGQEWVDRSAGVLSSHRCMRQGQTATKLGEDRDSEYNGRRDLSYIRTEDTPLALENLNKACKSIVNDTMSMKGIVDHCENLGHAEIPFFEGLNVELLPFQRQSVQFALERETVEGGVQSLLWLKLPKVATKHTDVYYNPILESFRTDKPRLVRGGIIGEEMGLGKTIISLSLILVNPAPAVPATGSDVSSLDQLDESNGVTWDRNLYSTTSDSNAKRGKILSRGTLVICPVSLVGQWIEEAKSRLADPGMIYSYHGGNRKRDPNLLAQQSIVVTTYDILRSDAVYHKGKSDDPANYVAPLEQIRWWRIICDEAHSTRSHQKSNVVSNLVGDHKWLVSGTPVSTSLTDLKNQLSLLGIENVPAMFSKFAGLLSHTGDKDRKKGGSRRGRHLSADHDGRLFGHFMFLLRSLVMRHAQAQVYRGTNPPTTLMSLPPKTERVVEVEWQTAGEKREYAALETEALNWYSAFKESNARNLGKYYLRITQKLMPMRIACSGGHIPQPEDDAAVEESDGGDENQAEGSSSKKKGKSFKYSEFAFSAKVNALIRELKTARDKDPTSKSLVFSQFASSLKYMQKELPKHGFEFRTLSGDMSMKKRAKALSDFQKDPPTTIFLLSMRAGAVGINLTQANRVFLLEPCFNPALVKQSVGRVYRLGQKRSVEIVRLVMKDTVESRTTEMLKSKYGDDSTVASTTKASTASVMVGSMNSDKAEILGNEFDLLFGTGQAEGSENPTAAVAGGTNDTEMQDLMRAASSEGNDRSSQLETGEL